MIQRYNRQNKRIASKTNLNRKFLAFCNWSFIKEKHLKEQDALKLFDSFEIEKSPFYIRIFNEMPRAVLDDFIARNNICKEKVLNIYNNLLLNTSYKVDSYEYKEIVKDTDNITSIEKQNLFKEQYNKKLQDIQKLKDNFIKNNSLSLKYITDRTAFKIPYNGVICDWHGVAMLHTNHYLLHPIDIIGAESIFADYGLYDCSEYFKSENRDIFELTGTNLCATPIRAILDILFYNIYVLNRYPKKLEHFHDDYMMDEINYDELFEKIAILRKNFNDSQKVILDEFFEKELKDSKSIYCNEIIYNRNKEGSF